MERILEKTKIGGKFYNLREADMPRVASFESNDMGFEITLIPSDTEKDEHTGFWSKKPHTGCTVKFKGGKLIVQNKKLFELVMSSSAYTNNKIRVDPEDPTGFWREAGILKVENRPTLVADRPANPKSVNLAAIKPLDEDEVVVPVARR